MRAWLKFIGYKFNTGKNPKKIVASMVAAEILEGLFKEGKFFDIKLFFAINQPLKAIVAPFKPSFNAIFPSSVIK